MIMQGVINSAPAFRAPFSFNGETYISNGFKPAPGTAFSRIVFTLKANGTYLVTRSTNSQTDQVIGGGDYLGSLKGSQVEAQATVTGDAALSNQLSSYVTMSTDKTVVFYVETSAVGTVSSNSDVTLAVRKISSPAVNESGSFDISLEATLIP